jgi:hypothetical protein
MRARICEQQRIWILLRPRTVALRDLGNRPYSLTFDPFDGALAAPGLWGGWQCMGCFPHRQSEATDRH